MYRFWYAVCNDFQKLTVGSRERPTTAVWMSRGQAWVQWLATGATVVTNWKGIPVAFARLQRLGQGLSPPAGVSPLLLGVHALWVGCCRGNDIWFQVLSGHGFVTLLTGT